MNGSQYSAKQRALMRAVELLRQPYRTDPSTLEELEAIADRLEELAKIVDRTIMTAPLIGGSFRDRRSDLARGPPSDGAFPTSCRAELASSQLPSRLRLMAGRPAH